MQFKKLRVSLTEACNYRCIYCDPEKPKSYDKSSHLPVDKLIQILVDFQALGIEEIKLTGGEPLLAHYLTELLCHKQFIALTTKKSITTNGQLLNRHFETLQQAGITDLNISVDSLDEALYHRMTGFHLQPVIDNIEQAIKLGFKLKINCVPMADCQPEKLPEMVKYFSSRNITVRFIELMKMGEWFQNEQAWQQQIVTQQQLLDIFAMYKPVLLPKIKHATAINYQTAIGVIGMILNTSAPFCSDCNRLRMNGKGLISGCISKPYSHDLSNILNLERSHRLQAIEKVFTQAITEKQSVFTGQPIPMRLVGG